MKTITLVFLTFFSLTQQARSEEQTSIIAHPFPQKIELTKEDYALIGEIVWRQLNIDNDPSAPELGDEDVARLVDELTRSGRGIHMRAEEFQKFIQARQLNCGATREIPGVDLGKLGQNLKNAFK